MPDAQAPDLSAVPLFPLPSVVLFPRAVLPLHIFEDRYRAMTADALAGDRLIAISLLKPGWEKSYYGKPAIEPVVCVGRIVSHEQLGDGKYNFLLEGLVRAAVVKEIAIDVPYRIAELRPLELIPATEDDLSPLHERLTALFARGPIASTGVGGQFRKMMAGDWPSPDIADLAAFTFLDDVAFKQTLLAEPDVHQRVTRTIEALELLAGALPKSASHPNPADPNMN